MASEHYSQIQPSTLPIRSIDTEQQQPDHTMVDPTPTSPFTSTTTSNGPYNPVPLSSALLASAMSSVDGFNPHAPVFTPAAENIGNSDLVPTSPSPEIDPQILEALRSKDRIYVLKLGEQMESLISERRFRLDLTPATSYQRLLVHRCSAYYRLQPDSDPVSKGISVSTTSDSRIPPRRLADLIPPDSSTPPAFQIMRRSSQNRRPKTHSQAGSVAGDDGDLSDVDESEAGSVGGRSNATGGSSKKRMTIEEREAAYNEARSRIFMNFEEKEKEKEKDMSSSSSLSVVSGSASTSGGSVGDIEDSVSSVATESEWSAPSFRKGRSSASNRSVRSSAHSFSSNGAGSSRNSRAPSPSFAFPSLYEPNASGIPYDAVQPGPVTTPGYLPANYYYPFVPGQAANSGYLAPYPPYYPYPYSAPPHPHNPSDPSSPPSGEMYAPHPIYHNSYNWAANQQSPPLPLPPPHPQSVPPPSTDGANGGNAPQNQGNAQFHPHPYVTTSPVYMYPMPGYYPQPPLGQSMMGPMPPQQPMMNQLYDHRSGDGSQEGGGHFDHNFGRGGYNPNSNPNPNRYSRTATFNGSTTNGKTRTNAPQPRHTWSYGPGIGGHNGPSDVGPRFNSTNRRQSNHSSGSSSGNYRSSNNWDEVSSTASSSTSSSSRRTYTSTSSQHPLPPRPDWAVGLKPDPTLHATNRHHESSNGSRSSAPMSPSRSLNGASSLQSADFPPLSSSPTEKRPPVVAGAWTNPPSTRALGQVTSLVQRSPSAANPNRLEETDRFERPPPRAAELYNPKMGPKRSSSNHSAKHSEKEDGIRGRDSGGSTLADQVRTLSLEAAPDG